MIAVTLAAGNIFFFFLNHTQPEQYQKVISYSEGSRGKDTSRTHTGDAEKVFLDCSLEISCRIALDAVLIQVRTVGYKLIVSHKLK